MPDNPQKTESEGVNTSSDSCVQAPFDLKLTEFTIRAKEILKRTARNVIELSQIAHDVHEAYGYQRYIQWVQADLGLSDRMGEKFLNVHSNFTEKISVDYEIATSALYLLSAPSTPEPAREEALSRAESGEKISSKLAKEIAEQAIREFCFSTTTPVKIRKNQAVITASFLRHHFDKFVAHHLANGSTEPAARSAIEEIEAQI